MIGTIVRHWSTGNVGEITAIDSLTALTVGDLAGTWFYVDWADGFSCWVQASSVEEIPA